MTYTEFKIAVHKLTQDAVNSGLEIDDAVAVLHLAHESAMFTFKCVLAPPKIKKNSRPRNIRRE